MGEFVKAIKCSQCNANLQIDFDNLTNYCPYCGTPIMLDIAIVKEVLIEKEHTKQIIGKEKEKTAQILGKEQIQMEGRITEDRNFTARQLASLIVILVIIVFLLTTAPNVFGS